MAEPVESRAETELPSFPMPRTCPLRPPTEYARMRAQEPVAKVSLRHGRSAWLLTRQQDIRAMLLHPQASTDRKHPGFPLQVRLPRDIPDARLTSLIGLDPPEHTALRRLVIPEFTVKQVQGLWDARVLLVGAVLALASSVVPYSFEFRALRRMPTRTFSLLMSLEPGVAALTGLRVLGERLSVPQWLGLGCVVVASLAVVALARERPSPAPGPGVLPGRGGTTNRVERR